jgi:hypothetical protein
MRAVAIHEFGGPEVLQVESMAPPTPMEHECLLKVHAAGVNPGRLQDPCRQIPGGHGRQAPGRAWPGCERRRRSAWQPRRYLHSSRSTSEARLCSRLQADRSLTGPAPSVRTRSTDHPARRRPEPLRDPPCVRSPAQFPASSAAPADRRSAPPRSAPPVHASANARHCGATTAYWPNHRFLLAFRLENCALLRSDLRSSDVLSEPERLSLMPDRTLHGPHRP